MEIKHFDFDNRYKNPRYFMSTHKWRCVRYQVQTPAGLTKLSDMPRELVYDSALADVLAVTMYELQTGESLDFTYIELMQFLPDDYKSEFYRTVKRQDRGMNFSTSKSVQLRIRKDPQVLQFVMDRLNVFYTGFRVPIGFDAPVDEHDWKPEILLDYKLPVVSLEMPIQSVLH